MANFDRMLHWQRFVPLIGNNRDLPEREQLALEIAVGMTKVEFRGFVRCAEALDKIDFSKDVVKEGAQIEEIEEVAHSKVAQALALGWSPFVRLVPGDNTIRGKAIVTIEDYLLFCCEQPGFYNYKELLREVIDLNSVEGTKALFSGAPSGGASSTAGRSREQKGVVPAVH